MPTCPTCGQYRYRDLRSWYRKQPVYGSSLGLAIVYPDERDVEVLGARVAAWWASQMAGHFFPREGEWLLREIHQRHYLMEAR